MWTFYFLWAASVVLDGSNLIYVTQIWMHGAMKKVFSTRAHPKMFYIKFGKTWTWVCGRKWQKRFWWWEMGLGLSLYWSKEFRMKRFFAAEGQQWWRKCRIWLKNTIFWHSEQKKFLLWLTAELCIQLKKGVICIFWIRCHAAVHNVCIQAHVFVCVQFFVHNLWIHVFREEGGCLFASAQIAHEIWPLEKVSCPRSPPWTSNPLSSGIKFIPTGVVC